jgi:hypothetical protein
MAGIDDAIVIGRPVDVVFDYVADQSNEPQYNSQMVRAEKITAGPVGPAEPNGEALTCEKILATSRWVWGRLGTLAPISGSYGAWRAGSLPGVKIIKGCPDLGLAGSLAHGGRGPLNVPC